MANTKSNNSAGGTTPQLGQWWWIPPTVVIAALLLLLIVPSAIDHRARKLRDAVTMGERARTALNDFEASLATELLERTGTTGQREASVVTENELDTDLAELHATLAEIDGVGRTRYDSLSTQLKSWRASTRRGGAAARDEGLRLIATAETIDNFLASFVDDHRTRALAVTRYYTFVPAILAPIALCGVLLSMWLARRVQIFAAIADQERAEVTRAAESRAALLRGVTHDVKNPLGAAIGYAQLLEEGLVGTLEPAQLNMVKRIRNLVGLSTQTVTDLLELARVDGTLHLEYAETDLAVVIREMADDHHGMAQERGIALDVVGDSVTVMTDAMRVRQILANLITNALKYSPSGGHVVVRLVDGGKKRIGVAVEDTGPGIPRELEAKIFEEFFRVRTEASGSGNGLGLAISRRIGRLLGGDVTYARREEGGSAFTVWLPFEAKRNTTGS